MMIKMQFHVWPPPFYLPHFRQRQSSKAASVCAKLRITNLIREEKPSFIPDLPQCSRFFTSRKPQNVHQRRPHRRFRVGGVRAASARKPPGCTACRNSNRSPPSAVAAPKPVCRGSHAPSRACGGKAVCAVAARGRKPLPHAAPRANHIFRPMQAVLSGIRFAPSGRLPAAHRVRIRPPPPPADEQAMQADGRAVAGRVGEYRFAKGAALRYTSPPFAPQTFRGAATLRVVNTPRLFRAEPSGCGYGSRNRPTVLRAGASAGGYGWLSCVYVFEIV